jgi:diguanylate cyclase (GGDEF)-like protein
LPNLRVQQGAAPLRGGPEADPRAAAVGQAAERGAHANWQRGLVVGFAAIITFMILLTGVGLLQMRQHEQRLDRIVNDYLVKLEHAAGMLRNARERTLSLQRMLLSDDPFERDDLKMAFGRFAGEFIEARTALLAMELSPQEQILLDRQGSLTSRAVPLQRDVLALIDADEFEEAARLLGQQAIPAQNAVLEVLNEFNELQRSSAQLAAGEASQLQAQARTLILVLSGLALLVSLIVAFSAVRKVRGAAAEREYLATHDALTGLPNRVLLLDRLDQALRRDRREHRKTGILFIDLDGFKVVNDTLGHAVGDQLLKQVAQRLCGAVRESDTIARLGGDEFVVLVNDARDMADITNSAERVLDCFREVFRVARSEIFSGASLGISVYPDHAETPAELLKLADIAMYEAKEAGRNTSRIYAQAMGSRAHARLDLETALRKALARDEFRLYYQPIVTSASGRVTGIEALLRWEHPERGLIAPAEFVPLLEDTGLIVPVGEWVMASAAAQLRQWRELPGMGQLRLAVNLSPRQFGTEGFATGVQRILQAAGLPAGSFELELTERLLMRHDSGVNSVLHALAGAGVLLAIDDFGIGYSSLGRLKNLPIHHLKIDRSFVCDMAVDSNDCAIVNAIIAMARSLDIGVVAEGVESVQQAHELTKHGDIELQGFLFSRPLPADEMTALLRRDQPFAVPALSRQTRLGSR